MFMPKRYARITLELTDVRVQRVQEISEDDARAEGFTSEGRPGTVNDEPATVYAFDSRAWFAQGWAAINSKRAPWSSNPWTWALTFRRLP
jgi:hypothetical protein